MQPILGGGNPNIKISQNSKKILKNVAASGFGIPKWVMNCYF